MENIEDLKRQQRELEARIREAEYKARQEEQERARKENWSKDVDKVTETIIRNCHSDKRPRIEMYYITFNGNIWSSKAGKTMFVSVKDALANLKKSTKGQLPYNWNYNYSSYNSAYDNCGDIINELYKNGIIEVKKLVAE